MAHLRWGGGTNSLEFNLQRFAEVSNPYTFNLDKDYTSSASNVLYSIYQIEPIKKGTNPATYGLSTNDINDNTFRYVEGQSLVLTTISISSASFMFYINKEAAKVKFKRNFGGYPNYPTEVTVKLADTNPINNMYPYSYINNNSFYEATNGYYFTDVYNLFQIVSSNDGSSPTWDLTTTVYYK